MDFSKEKNLCGTVTQLAKIKKTVTNLFRIYFSSSFEICNIDEIRS